MTKSYFEEFDKKYNRPQIDNITVGFSGIDPAPKSNDDIGNIEAILADRTASKEEINAMLDEVWG